MNIPYWRVSPKFWADAELWNDDMRLLALYLLTCEHRTTEGLFRLPLRYMAGDLGWDDSRVSQALAELLVEGFVGHDPDRQLVLIVKAMKYQSPQNPNQVTHALRKLQAIPGDSPLTSTFRQLAELYCERLAERLPEGFGNPPSPTPTPSPTRSWLSSDESKDRDEPISELSTEWADRITRITAKTHTERRAALEASVAAVTSEAK